MHVESEDVVSLCLGVLEGSVREGNQGIHGCINQWRSSAVGDMVARRESFLCSTVVHCSIEGSVSRNMKGSKIANRMDETEQGNFDNGLKRPLELTAAGERI